MKIALTYDDGPDPVWTRAVLEELHRHGSTATFFVQARLAKKHPSLIRMMRDSGHEIGFHCVEHVRHSEMAAVEIERDVANGLEILASLDVYPAAWRTPWGDITPATRRSASARSLNLFAWNLDSHDWRGDTSPEMLESIKAEGGLREGSIVLMHDGIGPGARRAGCEQTVRLTSALLRRSTVNGFETVGISQIVESPVKVVEST